MFPDGINGSNSHLVRGCSDGDVVVVGGEDQQVAAVHALGVQRELGFNDNRGEVKVGTEGGVL